MEQSRRLRLLRVQNFLKVDAQLFPYWLKLLEVLVVLGLVLDLGLDTCKCVSRIFFSSLVRKFLPVNPWNGSALYRKGI